MERNSILRNKVLIVGCGRFGSSIANKYAEEGKNLVVVDANPGRFDKLSDSYVGYKVVGDGTNINVLKKAQIETAKKIIITSGSDNANVLIAHMARKIFDVPEIYVRLEDPDSEVLVKELKVNTIYPFELSFEEFKRIGGDK